MPMRSIAQRVLFAALLAFSVALIYAEKQQKDWVGQLRMSMMNMSAPLANIAASPAKAMQELGEGWTHLWQVHSENRQLRFDNAQLLEWRDVALRLEAENASLRELMDYTPLEGAHFISAKVIGANGGGVAHRMLVNAGSAQGAAKHMPVINAHGLVGRTLEVSAGSAEVMLLSDIRSRIPVVLQPSGIRAMLVGDHGPMPYLKFADAKAIPALGEVVLSSDDGGLLPAGLHVGTVFAAGDKRFDVRLSYRDARLDYVRILERR